MPNTSTSFFHAPRASVPFMINPESTPASRCTIDKTHGKDILIETESQCQLRPSLSLNGVWFRIECEKADGICGWSRGSAPRLTVSEPLRNGSSCRTVRIVGAPRSIAIPLPSEELDPANSLLLPRSFLMSRGITHRAFTLIELLV